MYHRGSIPYAYLIVPRACCLDADFIYRVMPFRLGIAAER